MSEGGRFGPVFANDDKREVPTQQKSAPKEKERTSSQCWAKGEEAGSPIDKGGQRSTESAWEGKSAKTRSSGERPGRLAVQKKECGTPLPLHRGYVDDAP